MGDFFRGWRRKTGMITLVTALLFVAAWGRSENGQTEFKVTMPFDNKHSIGLQILPEAIHVLKYVTVPTESGYATGAQRITRLYYWRIVPPLTLLSAYLLLSKSRSAPKHAVSPPAGAKD